MEGKTEVLLDTCVLINFATIGRLDLLASHPQHDFFITDHVRAEVREHYNEQFDAVNAAIDDGALAEIIVNSPQELSDFALLVSKKNLGTGECSAIAAAKSRSLILAIDDRKAKNRAAELDSTILFASTESLMVSLIQEGVLTVEEADVIKTEWETHHSFKLMFSSFLDRI